jgi:hypothetical protein
MKINRKSLEKIIKEELKIIFVEDPDFSDSWHPSEIVPKEDAWAGGDNIDTPVDHAYYETGETNSGNHSSLSWDPSLGSESDDRDLWTCQPENSIYLLENDGEEGDSIQVVEREEVVKLIKNKMKNCGITGLDESDKGLLEQVNDADEFEDLIRHIFNQTGFDNTQLAVVAKAIAESFIEDPEEAENLSVYDF